MMFASRKTHIRDVAARWLADRSGATAVEFALVAAPFLGLLLGIIQIILVFFGQELLESVVQQASRYILTNQVQTSGMGQAQFASLVCAQVRIIFNCNNLIINVQSSSSSSGVSASLPTLTFNSQGQVTNAWQFNPGGPGDLVVVQVMYPWPVFLGPLSAGLANEPNGTRLIAATAAFYNEP
jgi:Flp pilus assembly protein TadG